MTIFFFVVAAVILVSALMVVTSRNLVHAALWLVSTLFGVAVLYTMLNAGFLAVVQVVVYIGAIAILFIFTVMLTRREMRDRGPGLNKNWPFAAVTGVVVFVGIWQMVSQWTGFPRSVTDLPSGFDAVSTLGNALISPKAFVLPFEVASLLLLAALVGAVYIAYGRK